MNLTWIDLVIVVVVTIATHALIDVWKSRWRP